MYFFQDHRTPITDNGCNYQIHQQQSGFISFYNNNNTNSTTTAATPSPNNSFHFSSFISNGSLSTNDPNINKENELYCRSSSNTAVHHKHTNEPVFVGGGGELVGDSFCANSRNEFSCVQVVDENRPNAGVAHRDYYSVIQQQKKLNKFIVESTLGGCTGMRLNIPAVNMKTTTIINNNSDTVNNSNNTHNFYVSSSSTTTTTVSSDVTSTISLDNRNSGQGSLTIPVNQQTSSVNIVNCYRTVPVQLVNNNNDENDIKKENCQSNEIINDNKCDIIEVDEKSSNNDDDENEKSDKKLSSNIINISTIENINQITSDNDNKNIAKVNGVEPFDTSKLEQSIYISSSDQTNIDAISSVHDPIIIQENALLSSPVPTSREQRRRERRERRAVRNRMAHIHALHSQAVAANANPNHITAAQMHLASNHAIISANPVRPGNFEIIPDLLHSHLPPPYTTLPSQPTATTTIIATPVPVPVSAVDNCRYSFPLPIIRR